MPPSRGFVFLWGINDLWRHPRDRNFMESDNPGREGSVKIVHVATVSATLRSFLLPFARFFTRKGWQVDGIAGGIAGCRSCEGAYHTRSEVPWRRNPVALANFVKAAPQVRSLVLKGGYDIVHVHTPVAAFVTRWALRKLRRQGRVIVIYTAHGFHFHKLGSRLANFGYLLLERIAARWTDYLIVINQEDCEAAKRYHLVPAEKLILMPGIGVDASALSAEGVRQDAVEKVRSELGLPADGVLFLMIAEFTLNKRHSDVLRAMALTRDVPFVVAFAGDGANLQAMKALAVELGVSERTFFLGFREDIPVLIRAARATLMVSLREGLPRSIMESLCLEVPAIGTDIRGVRDLLSDGCGILVPPKDPRALSDALRQLAEDSGLASAMGRRGREKMTGEYRLENIIDMHEKLYTNALAKVGGRVS